MKVHCIIFFHKHKHRNVDQEEQHHRSFAQEMTLPDHPLDIVHQISPSVQYRIHQGLPIRPDAKMYQTTRRCPDKEDETYEGLNRLE